jgi:hypothetical protein
LQDRVPGGLDRRPGAVLHRDSDTKQEDVNVPRVWLVTMGILVAGLIASIVIAAVKLS